MSWTKKDNNNPYSTRTLVNSSLVAYIKPSRGALEGEYLRLHAILERIDRLERDQKQNSAYGGSM
jgi:hypothetical protein